MANLTIMRSLHILAGGALLLVANAGHAQFVWIDAKGVKQFSDRPPPPGTPQKNILKARNIPAASDPAPASAPAAVTVAPKEAPPSLAEREADYRKRKEEQTALEKKAGTEAESAKIKAAACTAARQSKVQLDTGAPIRNTDAERSWLDDKQRAERKSAANKVIDEHCG